jgi:quercetin dioxygenase-like cupin family protein
MRNILLGLTVLAGASTSPHAQPMAHPDLFAGPAEMKYGPVPPAFPPGAQVAVLSGNPFGPGDYVLRLKMPAGYIIPAHNHPTVENVTVISGQFHAGMGDRLDKARSLTFKPGGFAALPANMNHFAWTSGETVVQVHGMGPFAITYVNPKDDPSRK